MPSLHRAQHAGNYLTFNVYAIGGVSNKWLQNYLTNRKQYVLIDDHSFDLLDLTCGVPQCSVLGPILFFI